MPQFAQVIVELFGTRVGLYRTLAFEITSLQAEAGEAAVFAVERGMRSLLDYLQHHMQLGRLRPMDPLAALQLLLGPFVVHLLTRSLAE